MPVEQIGYGHESASLRNRGFIFFLGTGLYLPYELPNLALFTRKLWESPRIIVDLPMFGTSRNGNRRLSFA
jgi:hypothetical protein